MNITYNADLDIKILKKRIENYYSVDLNDNKRTLNDDYYIKQLKVYENDLILKVGQKDALQKQYSQLLKELEKHYLWHLSINCII